MPFDYRLRSIFESPDYRDRLGLPPLDGGGAAPADNALPSPAPAASPLDVSAPRDPAPAADPDALPKNVSDFQAAKANRDATLAALKDAQAADSRTRFFNTLGAAFNQAGNSFSGRNRQAVQAPVTAVQDVLTQQKLGAGLDQEGRANAAEGRAAQLFGPQFETATAKAKYAGDEAAADAAMRNAHAQLFGQQATKGALDLQDAEAFRNALRTGDSRATAVVLGLAKKYNPQLAAALEGAKGSEVYPLLPTMEKGYQADAMAAYRQALLAQRDQRFEQTHGEKTEQFDTKREDQLAKGLGQLLNPYAAKGGLRGLMDRVTQAELLKRSVARAGGNPDRRQIEELAIGLNKLLSGSSGGAQHQVEALVPQTIWGDVNKLAERISNEPTGLGQQKFVSRMLETIEGEERKAAEIARNAVKQGLPEFSPLREMNRGRYESMLRARGFDPEIFDEKGLEKSGGAAPSGGGKAPADPLGIR